MAPRTPRSSTFAKRLGWALFAVQVLALFAIALWFDHKAPRPIGNADIAPDGTRFGLSEAKRRDYFQQLLRGEKENRDQAEKMKEGLIWNRNHDSYFHQYEWGRILWWSHRLGIAEWQGWLILDEGLRNHWAPPPQTPVLIDEAPLAPTTRPLAKRPVMIPAPPPPPSLTLPVPPRAPAAAPASPSTKPIAVPAPVR